MTAFGPGLHLRRTAAGSAHDLAVDRDPRRSSRCSGSSNCRWRAAQHRGGCSHEGGYEVAPRPLSADRRASTRSGSPPCGGSRRASRSTCRLLRCSSLLELGRVWVLATLGPALDDAHHRRSRRAAGRARALSLRQSSQLSGRDRRDCGPAAGVRAVARSPLLFSLLNAAVLTIRIRAENRALGR